MSDLLEGRKVFRCSVCRGLAHFDGDGESLNDGCKCPTSNDWEEITGCMFIFEERPYERPRDRVPEVQVEK